MDTDKVIEKLNAVLEQEHACAIRYATHAAMITGPYAEAVAARLAEIATDEIEHAKKLRERITVLGAQPSMQVSTADLKYADTLDEILQINIDEEKHAIAEYLNILKLVREENVILYRTLQDIIQDEQQHLEELEMLVAAH